MFHPKARPEAILKNEVAVCWGWVRMPAGEFWGIKTRPKLEEVAGAVRKA